MPLCLDKLAIKKIDILQWRHTNSVVSQITKISQAHPKACSANNKRNINVDNGSSVKKSATGERVLILRQFPY